MGSRPTLTIWASQRDKSSFIMLVAESSELNEMAVDLIVNVCRGSKDRDDDP